MDKIKHRDLFFDVIFLEALIYYETGQFLKADSINLVTELRPDGSGFQWLLNSFKLGSLKNTSHTNCGHSGQLPTASPWDIQNL
jgi:hypothetical protein